MNMENNSFPPKKQVKFVTHDQGLVRTVRGHLAVESVLEIAINGRAHSILMQTPGREKELVTGFLHTEGLIEGVEDLGPIVFTESQGTMGIPGLKADAEIPGLKGADFLPERPAISLSSCGLCGKEALTQLGRGLTHIKSKQKFPWPVLAGLLSDLKNHQPLYLATRGTHAASMYQADGEWLCCFEDVGRHNALDKVIGRALIQGWDLSRILVLISGRASLEMVMKTARAGIPLLFCFSNPTVLAVEAAKSLNLTLVGRQADRSLAGFTHTRRLILPTSSEK